MTLSTGTIPFLITGITRAAKLLKSLRQGYEVDTQGGLPLRRILKGNRYSSVGRSWN
jgi:hypothetical protein